MKNKEGLTNLASLLTAYRKEYYPDIIATCKKISDSILTKEEGVDPNEELQGCLNRTLNLLVTKLDAKSEFDDTQIELVKQAIEYVLREKSPLQSTVQKAIELLYVHEAASSVSMLLTQNLIRIITFESFCENDKVLTQEEMKVIQLFEGLNNNEKLSIEKIAILIDESRERTKHIKMLASVKIIRAAKAIKVLPS